MGVRGVGYAKNIILQGLEAFAWPYESCPGRLARVRPYPRGMQRVVSKRMKAMELLAFLCNAGLLAVEKNGMALAAVRRGRPLKTKAPANCWRPTERITVLPTNTYTPEVTSCQEPKWETLFASGG